MNELTQDALYRLAAALSTEGTGDQSVVDVLQVLKNRKTHGGYGATFDEMLTRKDQFAGVTHERDGRAFLNIRNIEQAARWAGVSTDTIKSYSKAILNPELRANAEKHVGRALEFRASPQNYKLLKNTAWRGGRNDNQFLTGPEDPQLPKPKLKPKPTVPTVKPKPKTFNPLSILGKAYKSTNPGQYIF